MNRDKMVRPKEGDCTLAGALQGELTKGDDPIRALLRRMMQEALEEEMASHLNAERYLRTE